jgi:TolB protein
MTPAQWTAPPASAGMLALGALSADNGRLAVYGWLMDVTTAGSPPVLTRQYNEQASEDMARTLAHRFADEIIARLGGGVNGICETRIYFVSNRTGSKEIWVMDYDGANQHAVTHLGTVSMSPRISPDDRA